MANSTDLFDQFTPPQAPQQQAGTLVDPKGQMVNYIDAQGRPQTAPLSKVPKGTPYYRSEQIGANGSTPSGDIFNQFRGYVSPQGGGFGFGDPTVQNLEGLTGVKAAQLGVDANTPPEEIMRLAHLYGGIANGDVASRKAALSDPNAFLKQTAQSYALGRGSKGIQSILDAGGNYEGAQAFGANDADMNSHGVVPGMEYETALQNGYVTADGKSTGKYEAMRGQQDAAQADWSKQFQHDAAPRFDVQHALGQTSDAHDTAGVITPAIEAKIRAQQEADLNAENAPPDPAMSQDFFTQFQTSHPLDAKYATPTTPPLTGNNGGDPLPPDGASMANPIGEGDPSQSGEGDPRNQGPGSLPLPKLPMVPGTTIPGPTDMGGQVPVHPFGLAAGGLTPGMVGQNGGDPLAPPWQPLQQVDPFASFGIGGGDPQAPPPIEGPIDSGRRITVPPPEGIVNGGPGGPSDLGGGGNQGITGGLTGGSYLPAGGFQDAGQQGRSPTPFASGGMRPIGRAAGLLAKRPMRPIKPQAAPIAGGAPVGPGSAAGGMGGVGLSSLSAY